MFPKSILTKKKYRFDMKKIILAASLVVSISCAAQTANNDSLQKLQKQYQQFTDSIYSHTSLKEFRDFLYERVTTKFFSEGTFADLYQYYTNEKWNARNKKQ
jgi:nucleoside-specific outer membrane channel protein Tsx